METLVLSVLQMLGFGTLTYGYDDDDDDDTQS